MGIERDRERERERESETHGPIVIAGIADASTTGGATIVSK